MISENRWGQKWLPAISTGFAARMQVRNVGGMMRRQDTTNGDLYLVATKTVTQVKGLPLLFNFGYKGANASIFGLAGNATAFRGRMFGAGAIVPTTTTYLTRIVPIPEKAKLNVDFGVGQVANQILPGVKLHSRHQFAMGISIQL